MKVPWSVSCLSACLFSVIIGTSCAVQTTQLGQSPSTQPSTQPATQRGAAESNPPADGFDLEGSDVKAIELADAVMGKLGGRTAWDETRYVRWNFFGRRVHLWDKHQARVRIELDGQEGVPYVYVLNINTKQGRAWRGDEEVTDPTELAAMMDQAEAMWINDSYWLVMPYKLKDTGVTLKYVGEGEMQDARPADVLQLTFNGVGRTPHNKYHVYIARDSGLVEQWDYYDRASDDAPRFKVPWHDWKRYGRIMLSGDRGEARGQPVQLTPIAVFDELPESVFTGPEPVELNRE